MCAGPHRHSFLKPPSLRGCQGDGGVPGPGPKADLQGGHGPALAPDPHLQKITELADRVFCIYNEPAAAKGRGKAEARVPGAQRTLEAYS